jgi:hypothetical protein
MTDLSEDFRPYLLSKTTIADLVGARVFQNKVPQTATMPFVCYFRRQTLVERATNETNPKATMVSFDVECVDDSQSGANALAEAVRTAIDGQRGTFGSTTVQGVFVEDHDDDYIPKVNDSDDVVPVATFQVEIYP